MTKRKSEAVEITAESLQLDAPVAEGVNVGGFLPADGTASDLPASPEVEAPATWADRAKAVRAAANALPDEDAPTPEHVDIGNWEATLWRGRRIWRHKRTGKTLHNRDEVRRQRNLK